MRKQTISFFFYLSGVVVILNWSKEENKNVLSFFSYFYSFGNCCSFCLMYRKNLVKWKSVTEHADISAYIFTSLENMFLMGILWVFFLHFLWYEFLLYGGGGDSGIMYVGWCNASSHFICFSSVLLWLLLLLLVLFTFE